MIHEFEHLFQENEEIVSSPKEFIDILNWIGKRFDYISSPNEIDATVKSAKVMFSDDPMHIIEEYVLSNYNWIGKENALKLKNYLYNNPELRKRFELM